MISVEIRILQLGMYDEISRKHKSRMDFTCKRLDWSARRRAMRGYYQLIFIEKTYLYCAGDVANFVDGL
jgi:hypothetical protein